jgi:hypothetical protein
VILPHVSRANFGDDEESRQLLYVSLSRARRRLLICLAAGAVPAVCERLGLVVAPADMFGERGASSGANR